MAQAVAAVVTGHSRGVGEAVAAHLLARGARVLGLARGRNAHLAARYGDALSQVELDLSDASALNEWLRGDALTTHLHGAELRFLVNNAGSLQPMGPLDVQDVGTIASTVSLNVSAALVLSAAFAAVTNDGRERRILHISSGAGRKGYAGWSVYCATKAALDNHARSVALDRSAALRICTVAPGVIDTEMQAEIRSSSEELIPDRQRYVTMHREGRLISAASAGRAAVDFLFSSDFGKDAVMDLPYGAA